MEQKKDFAIVIIGYDGYSFLWSDFFNLFNLNWPDCPYNIYLLTNEINFNYKNVKTITTSKKSEWSQKVRKAIDSIDEKYFLLLLEDFFISEKINNKEIEKMIHFIQQNNIVYAKLPYKGQFNKFKNKKFSNQKNYYMIYQDEYYCISLLPSIWEKNFLNEKIGEGNYRPWQFEIDRIEEAKKNTHIPFKNCVEITTNPFKILNGVVQGKFLPTTVNTLKRRGYYLHTDELGVLNWKKYYFLRLKTIGLLYIPQRLHKYIKSFLSIFNIQFVSQTKKDK